MIDYDFGDWGIAFIFSLQGSVFQKVLVFAIPCTLVCCALNLWFTWLWGADKPDISGAMNVWSNFTFVLGFLIVFRTQIAYGRFWEGGTTLQQVRGVWFNATSNLIAFCSADSKRLEEVQSFQHLLVRLMSMLYCAALQQVAQMSDESFEVIEYSGIAEDSLEYLANSEDQMEVLMQWIQRLIICSIDSGIIPIAPPITSRVFQELSNGIVDVQNAKKITEFPFPFPYAQMLTVMLLMHLVLTPVIAAMVVDHWAIAAIVTFVTTFSLWSINFIAAELEMPFGDDHNDLPVEEMQSRFNSSLRTLLHPLCQNPPVFHYHERHNIMQGIRNVLTSRQAQIEADELAVEEGLDPVKARRKTWSLNSDDDFLLQTAAAAAEAHAAEAAGALNTKDASSLGAAVRDSTGSGCSGYSWKESPRESDNGEAAEGSHGAAQAAAPAQRSNLERDQNKPKKIGVSFSGEVEEGGGGTASAATPSGCQVAPSAGAAEEQALDPPLPSSAPEATPAPALQSPQASGSVRPGSYKNRRGLGAPAGSPRSEEGSDSQPAGGGHVVDDFLQVEVFGDSGGDGSKLQNGRTPHRRLEEAGVGDEFGLQNHHWQPAFQGIAAAEGPEYPVQLTQPSVTHIADVAFDCPPVPQKVSTAGGLRAGQKKREKQSNVPPRTYGDSDGGSHASPAVAL
eukprot:TRINITY_DN25484_c0_g2_i1.p1 TRINITY_DN25484_c0_g2~~TRINITY_DN25484_c0_g2_i1.p1  ORF type:complete len:678 (-),score=179.84 TRINITY_DN25484_c0_g2_i1:83-2116(-)